MVSPFRDEIGGLAALIETYAGKRTYYIYVTPGFDAYVFRSSISSKLPNENIKWQKRDDPEWQLL